MNHSLQRGKVVAFDHWSLPISLLSLCSSSPWHFCAPFFYICSPSWPTFSSNVESLLCRVIWKGRGAWRDHCFPAPFSSILNKLGQEELKIPSANCFSVKCQSKGTKKRMQARTWVETWGVPVDEGNFVARRILKAPWTTPKNVLFEQLQWPSLSWRRSIATTCLLHQLLQNPTDPLKDCLFPFFSTVSSYNFRKPRQLILPTTRTSRYLNSFFYHSALLWNSLPSSIQSITKPNHFRQALTSHWREQKYQPVSELFWLTNPLPHHFFYFIFFFQMLINAMCCYLPFWRPPRSGNFPVGESVKYY